MDWNPLKFQRKVIEAITQGFDATMDAAIAQNMDVESLKFVESVQNCTLYARDDVKNRKIAAEKTLKQLHKLRKRVRRKKESKNAFVEIIDAKIRKLEPDLRDKIRDLEVWETAAEEVMKYDDIGLMIRWFQAGAEPGAGEPDPEDEPLGYLVPTP